MSKNDIKISRDLGRGKISFEVMVDEMDMWKYRDNAELMSEVWSQVATRMADVVMEKLGPAISEALKQIDVQFAEQKGTDDD